MILGFRILSGNLGSNVWARGSSIFDLVRVLVVTYTCLEDLADKAAVQEKCMVEEQKYSKVAQPKTRGTSGSHKRTWEQDGASRCGRCRRQHFGEYLQCFNCGQFGHISKNCRKPPRTQIAAPGAPEVAVGNCFGCNQPGHIYRDCRRRGNAALPPPPKRPAIAPRVFAVGDPQGAEPIAVRGLVSVEGESAHTLFDMGASHSFMIILGGVELLEELTELEMSFYDVILGIDWLSRQQVVLDSPKAGVNIRKTEWKIIYEGIQTHREISIISMIEEQKYSKVAQPKTRGTSGSHKRTWEQDGASRCGRCRCQHFGEYLQCFNCGQFGHISKNCRKPPRTQIAVPAAPAVAVGNCFGCNQPGHIYRDCRRRGNAALPPPPKRPAIAPRVFAVGDPQGAEPIAVRGLVSVEGESAHTLFDMGASHSFMIILGGVELLEELTELEMSFYDVILGIDWLSRHRVVLDCPKARVNIPKTEGKIIYEGIQTHREISIISMIGAEELLEGGAEGFLATISMTTFVFLSSRRSNRHQQRAIGVRMSPHAPPEDHPLRVRETHAPLSLPPRPAAISPQPGSHRRVSAVAGDFSGKPPLLRHRRRWPAPVTRRRLANLAESTRSNSLFVGENCHDPIPLSSSLMQTRQGPGPVEMVQESSEIFAGATTRHHHADLVPTVSNRMRSNRSQQRAIGVRMSPHAPPEDHPSRVRETHGPLSPPPRPAAISPQPGSHRRVSAVAGDFSGKPPLLRHRRRWPAPVTRRRLANLAESTRLTGLTFDQWVDFSRDIDHSRFKPFERRSDSKFRSDCRFGVHLRSLSS
ncbi:hypothetical protein F2Q69_00047496 [Brassica cretica]|uniref:CCHC-type domain-containing protein n=1 Tax=Brassica cretica TaxID=69181 RepID=A0A8S9PUX2_BRACR|nr:hypothetical protein F2Q69_00047496 [Brassica cretica]